MVLYLIVALIHIFSKISIAKHLYMTLFVSYLVLLSIQTFILNSCLIIDHNYRYIISTRHAAFEYFLPVCVLSFHCLIKIEKFYRACTPALGSQGQESCESADNLGCTVS